MAKKYLDENGLAYFWSKIKQYLATPTRAGLMSPTDKAKVDAITNDGTIAYYRKLEGSYITTTTGESTIAIPIASYSTADILLVDINGLDLVAGEDYTVSGSNIILTTPITEIGQVVHFVALRATTASTADYDTLKGDDGKGIVSVEKTGTSGLVDTYTITYTDGTTSTFIVTNGEDGGGSAPYLTSETASGTVAKTTTLVSGNLPATLETGQQVIVKFTNYNSASSPTLTVGSYGAIAIKRYGTTAPRTSANTSWKSGSVIVFIYDGTYWQMADWTNENTTYSSMSQSEMQTGTATTGRLITAARLKEAIEYFAVSSGTSVPTANEVAEFDSTAHMNSTDMTETEVDNFVDALEVSGVTVSDYVVEQGTSGIWTYRKWNSGIAECWGSNLVTTSFGNTFGALYYGTFSVDLPSGLFTSVTSATATRGANGGNSNGLAWISLNYVGTNRLGAYIIDSVSQTLTLGFSYNVKGRWK